MQLLLRRLAVDGGASSAACSTLVSNPVRICVCGHESLSALDKVFIRTVRLPQHCRVSFGPFNTLFDFTHHGVLWEGITRLSELPGPEN